MFGSAYIYLGRLTLTYQDIFGRKHACIADFDTLERWHIHPHLEDIATDLEDLEQAIADARLAAIRAQRASPIRHPGLDGLG